MAAGAALVLCLAAGVLYALRLPPFEKKKGKIEVSEVCRTLGEPSRSTTELDRVLPAKSSYTFHDELPDPRRDDLDDSYYSACFVGGDGKQLLVASAQMLEYEKTDAWVTEVVEQFAPASALTPFDAGDKAVATDKVAAIYVPCLARPAAHLSVVVQLKRPGGAPAAERRDALIALARNTALYAQGNARCDDH
ncbi:hypothetical protein ACIPD2_07015 [Streptomyces griseofuscus]|uniref:hypothetical protein n=1 Tax=Streptomyces TaxID=1883 RepID=UPI001EFC12E8|nr:hypothetical protein [Streptomyces sp. LamerLS-31b]